MKFTEEEYWKIIRFFSDMSTMGGCQGRAEDNAVNTILLFKEMGYEIVKVKESNE